MTELGYQYLLALIPILVAVDPLGSVPIYVAAAEQLSPPARRGLFTRSVLAAMLIALGFVFAGRAIFAFLGISVADFQIAGGAMLFLIALYEMIAAGRAPARSIEPAIVPLAVPLTIGPAVMTVSLELIHTRGPAATCLALITALGCLLTCLLLSQQLLKIVTVGALRAFAKIIYLLLAAIGVHYVRSGISTIVADLAASHATSP